MRDLHLAWHLQRYSDIEATNRFYVHQLPLVYMVQRYSASERVTLPSTDRGLCCFAFGVLLGTELLPNEERRDTIAASRKNCV